MRRALSIPLAAFAILAVSMMAQIARAQDMRAVRREIVFTRENQRVFYLDFSGNGRGDATLEVTSLNDSGSFAGMLNIGTVHPSTPSVTGTITIVRGTGPGARNALRIAFTATLETRLELMGSSAAPSSGGPHTQTPGGIGIPVPGGPARAPTRPGIITTTLYTFEGALRLGGAGGGRTFMAGSFTATSDAPTAGVRSAPGPYPFCAVMDSLPVG